MKNDDLWKSYGEYTDQASKNIRWLVGIFLGWTFFRIEDAFWLLLLFLSVLILDFLQYVSAALILKFWIEREERKYYEKYESISKDSKGNCLEYEKPRCIDTPAFFLWVFKIIIFGVAVFCFFQAIYSGGNHDTLPVNLFLKNLL